MFNIKTCDLKWLEARVKARHHNPLAKWLVQRSPEQKAEAEAAGWTANRIVEEAFFVVTGWTTVPKALMKALRNCPELNSMLVWRKLREMEITAVNSGMSQQEEFILNKWVEFGKFIQYRRPNDTETLSSIRKETLVWEVMTR